MKRPNYDPLSTILRRPAEATHVRLTRPPLDFRTGQSTPAGRKHYRLLAAVLSLLLAGLVLHAHAGPGDVDPSFDAGASVDYTIWPMAVQPDGKIIIGGGFVTPRPGIARLNTDGSVDASFNPGSGLPSGYVVGISPVYAIALQADGKVLIGGRFTSFNGTDRDYVARLNGDGSLDAEFNPLLGFNANYVYSIVVQPDGKILIGGAFNTVNGTNRSGIARLNSDGSLDASFNPGTGVSFGFTFGVYSIAVQPDGKVLIGGEFTSVNGTNRNRIARLNADGSLDTTFNPGTGANSSVRSVVVQSDGKALIGGDFNSVNGTNRSRIARLNSDGSLDTSFNPGSVGGGAIYSVALQSDDEVLIAGTFTSAGGMIRNRIARLNGDGSLDTDFDPGTGANEVVFTVIVQPNDKPLIGGTFTLVNGAGRNYIARLNADGNLDPSFNPGGSASSAVHALAPQSDGKVLVGGNFTSFNRLTRYGVARLNQNGSVDTSFSPELIQYLLIPGNTNFSIPGNINALTAQPDGRVIIGGIFNSVAGITRNFIARLNGDGSPDTSFNDPNFYASSAVNAVVLQSNGKVVIGGDFYNLSNFVPTNRGIARLNADGTQDTSFNPGAGANNEVRAVAVQSDGKVLIGGAFTAVNGTNRSGIARLNADGSLDTTFNTAAFLPTSAIVVQADGKVFIGGHGTGQGWSVARLNGDGTRDTNFNILGSACCVVRSLVVQPDGKVLVAGDLDVPTVYPWRNLLRINADGSFDGTFNPGSGPGAPIGPYVHSVALQPDGRVLIGGAFTAINRTARWWVARLFGDAPLINPPILSDELITLNWSAITGRTYRVQFNQDLNETNWTDLPPDITAASTNASKTDALTSPQRFYRVKLLTD